MKAALYFLIFILLSSCDNSKERDDELAKVIQEDFVLTDSLMTYRFLDTTTLEIKFGQLPQFEKYRPGIWFWRLSDGKDISTHNLTTTFLRDEIIKSNGIVIENIDLKGNHPDSMRITLDMEPVGFEFIDVVDNTAFTYYRYSPDSLTGILSTPRPFNQKYTSINYTYLYAIEDDEIREYCKKKVEDKFRYVNGR